MIELKLYVSEVDYASAIQAFAGTGLAGSTAVMAMKALPNSAKEELVVKYLNSNAEKLQGMLADAASRQGIRLTVSGAQATVVDG